MPRWALDYGMRFTYETKSATLNRVNSEGAVAIPQLGFEEFTEEASLDEFAFTPKVALRYEWADDTRFYASFAQGFKAGGFGETASNLSSAGVTDDAEKATAWELGSKTRLLDGAASLNATLYWHDAEDLQTLILNQLGTFRWAF